ncbi:MAG: hypothetical protein O8C66_03685 [Candidatus Methanoperedens sp.]|nr:hypothetical protein [Candidatus Methanoperedens sp.]
MLVIGPLPRYPKRLMEALTCRQEGFEIIKADRQIANKNLQMTESSGVQVIASIVPEAAGIASRPALSANLVRPYIWMGTYSIGLEQIGNYEGFMT